MKARKRLLTAFGLFVSGDTCRFPICHVFPIVLVLLKINLLLFFITGIY